VANGVLRNSIYQFVPYNLCTKFDSFDKAKAVADVILDKLRKTEPRTILILDEREVEYPNHDGSVLWVLKVPKSYYYGKYYSFLLSIKESGFKYDNNHRYQIARHRTDFGVEVKSYWEYLIADENEQYFWTTDRFQASLLTFDEQEKLVNKLNIIGRKQVPYLGYCQAQNLPCLFDEEPKYGKGNVVYTKNYDTKRFVKHNVVDIVAFEDGYFYSLSNDIPDTISLPCENFYEGNRLINGINVYSETEIRKLLKETDFKNWKICD
jgi:hypothetical protein